MAGEPVGDDRQSRGLVLYQLGIRFTSGNSAERRTEDLAILDRHGIRTEDLVEAGERIKASRSVNTYPPLSEILTRCTEARVSRLLADREASGQFEPAGRAMTPDEVDHGLAIMAVYKAGYHFCPVCRTFGPFCGAHRDADWHPPRRSTDMDLAAQIASGEMPRLREARAPAPKPRGLTPLTDEMEVPF